MENLRVSKQVLVWKMLQKSLKDTEGSENDHFSKDTLLASQAQGWGGHRGEAAFILTPLEAVHLLWNKRSKGSTWLLFDERLLADPAPLLLSNMSAARGLFSQDIFCVSPHACEGDEPHSTLHTQNQPRQGKHQGGPGCLLQRPPPHQGPSEWWGSQHPLRLPHRRPGPWELSAWRQAQAS